MSSAKWQPYCLGLNVLNTPQLFSLMHIFSDILYNSNNPSAGANISNWAHQWKMQGILAQQFA